jgi:uridine phosphorylase
MTIDPDTRMPLLNVRAGDVPSRILVVGDPNRATRVSQRLDGGEELSRNREYVLYHGRHRGELIGVVSHGVGAAGAAVCFEELCRSGVQRIVRAGTTGGLQPDIDDGDLVIATGAVRDDGLTARLVPLGYPAIADAEIVLALRAAARQHDARFFEGVVLTSDLFYPHPVLGDDLAMWARAGCVAVEMECSALFVTAALHGVAAGAILTVDGNPLRSQDSDMSGYDPHRPVVDAAIDTTLDIALDVVALSL